VNKYGIYFWFILVAPNTFNVFLDVRIAFISICFSLLISCQNHSGNPNPVDQTSLVILGIAQDAGAPQIGCKKACCKNRFSNPELQHKVVSLGIVDKEHERTYLFEATPDMPAQIRMLHQYSGFENELPDAIFLTHAHIGHYTGLMHLGKEAMNADSVEVFCMPRMSNFLKSNGPWSQLVRNDNINLVQMERLDHMVLSGSISVQPILVPHRDEFSETVGYIIEGPSKRVLFIPDIDKWQKWSNSITALIENIDLAFVDATFFDSEEINNRDISEIPHPFVIESMELFKDLSAENKAKIHFIHMNHTNPILEANSRQSKEVLKAGFNIAREGMVFSLFE